MIKRYLYHILKFLLLTGIFCGIFFTVFYLYRVPLEPVIYAGMLFFFAVTVYLILDLILFLKKHRELLETKKSIAIGNAIQLLPKNLIEKDYIDIIVMLQTELATTKCKYDEQIRNATEYYTMWAHQIKTPIAAMTLLLQQEPTAQNDTISLSLFEISRYVEMVLSYIRLPNMGNDLLLKQYNLDGIVKNAVHKYAKLFIAKKIQLSYKVLNKTVITDQKWFLFVVEQLLSNALKYTKKGTVSIYMEDYDTFVIADTGIGISSGDLPRLFEKGFTGFNGRMEQSSSGIGLYLCKNVLTNLSCEISIFSDETGTQVKIALPKVKLY